VKKIIIVMFVFLMPAGAHAEYCSCTTCGIGWEDGLSLRYPIGRIYIQNVVNADIISFTADAKDGTTTINDVIYIGIPVVDRERSWFNLYCGFGIFYENGYNPERKTDYAIRIGIEPEFQATDYLGISGKAGLQMYHDRGFKNISNSGSVGYGTYGSIGIHCYF